MSFHCVDPELHDSGLTASTICAISKVPTLFWEAGFLTTHRACKLAGLDGQRASRDPPVSTSQLWDFTGMLRGLFIWVGTGDLNEDTHASKVSPLSTGPLPQALCLTWSLCGNAVHLPGVSKPSHYAHTPPRAPG